LQPSEKFSVASNLTAIANQKFLLSNLKFGTRVGGFLYIVCAKCMGYQVTNVAALRNFEVMFIRINLFGPEFYI